MAAKPPTTPVVLRSDFGVTMQEAADALATLFGGRSDRSIRADCGYCGRIRDGGATECPGCGAPYTIAVHVQFDPPPTFRPPPPPSPVKVRGMK